MKKSTEKKERALGMKLFLKGNRCNSPKCAMVRKAYRPGMHGQKSKRKLSEYGQQLLEKQRIKTSYILREAQMRRIFMKALAKTGNVTEIVLSALERRLDNVVFRLGLANSRIIARQLINHGHFLVNNKKVNIPSYQVKIGDAITIKSPSLSLLQFNDLANNLKNYKSPDWLELDKEKLTGRMKSLPTNIEIPFNINLVVDYYSK